MILSDKRKAEIIERAKKLASESDTNKIKEVVCKFYQRGNHPDCYSPSGCAGCSEPDRILACRDMYLSRIFRNPMEVWTPEFDKVTVREKKKVDVIENIGLACNTCYIADKCPEKQTDAMCSIDFTDGNVDRTPKSILNKMIGLQQERVNKARVHEELDGGVPDQNLSAEIDRLAGLAQMKQELEADKFSLKIEASSNSKEGSREAGGILSRIFGGGQQNNLPAANDQAALPPAKPMETIDIPFTEEAVGEKVKKKMPDVTKKNLKK